MSTRNNSLASFEFCVIQVGLFIAVFSQGVRSDLFGDPFLAVYRQVDSSEVIDQEGSAYKARICTSFSYPTHGCTYILRLQNYMQSTNERKLQ